MNFQIFKLDSEKAEKPEVKLPTFVGSSKKQENSRKASTSASLTTLKPLTVWITQTVENSSRDGNTRPPACLLRNLYASQEASWNQTWNNRLVPNWERSTSRLYIVTLLINLYANYITWNARLDEAQAGIKIARRNINNLRNAEDTTLMAESEEELKSLLMKVKEESDKVGLNLSNQKLRSWHQVLSLHGK